MTRAKLLADEIVKAMPKKNPPKPAAKKEPEADEKQTDDNEGEGNEPEELEEPKPTPKRKRPAVADTRTGWFPNYFSDD